MNPEVDQLDAVNHQVIEVQPPAGSSNKPPPVDLRQVTGGHACPSLTSPHRSEHKKKTRVLTRGWVDDDERALLDEDQPDSPLSPKSQASKDDKADRIFSPRDHRAQAAAANRKAVVDAWLQTEGKSQTVDLTKATVTVKEKAKRIVTTGRFNTAAMCLIFTNIVYMGLETDNNVGADSNSMMWLWIDHAFTILFASELALRAFALGREFFRSGFNVFDSLLVVCSIFDAIIVSVMAATGDGNSNSSTKFIVALRIARLLRVVRALRLIRFFKDLWLIVSGVLQSARVVLWAWALILLIIYISGILITRMVGQPYSHDPVIFMYFGDVPRSMFSMFEVMTIEGWPTMSRRSMQYLPSVWIFFVLFISFTSFGIMNVLTAVIVESTLDMSRKHQQDIAKKLHIEKKRALNKIYSVFKLADRDGNEQLSKEEFLAALKMPDVVRALYECDIDMGDAESLFDILDYDGSGELDVTEFIQGCMSARGGAKARDVLAAQCDLWRTQTRMADMLKSTVDEWGQEFDSLEKEFVEIRQYLGKFAFPLDENIGPSSSVISPSQKRMHKIARRALMMPAGFQGAGGTSHSKEKDKKKNKMSPRKEGADVPHGNHGSAKKVPESEHHK